MSISKDSEAGSSPRPVLQPWTLKRVEHYSLMLLNTMAAGGSAGLSDGDIDLAIDLAERLAKRMAERGHIQDHE